MTAGQMDRARRVTYATAIPPGSDSPTSITSALPMWASPKMTPDATTDSAVTPDQERPALRAPGCANPNHLKPRCDHGPSTAPTGTAGSRRSGSMSTDDPLDSARAGTYDQRVSWPSAAASTSSASTGPRVPTRA